MKNVIFGLIVLLNLTALQAKENYEVKQGAITGVIMDAKLKAPLPYVNIVVKTITNDIITGGITNEDGVFNIDAIPEGSFKVHIQYIGYASVVKDVSITKTNLKVNLGTINLEENAAALDAVTVIAEVSTIQQKVDRKVITVGKDLTTSGPTASDIMNNLPSVTVDQQSGDISLRGNQNVQVMVDGKLSNIPASQLLKQIPSTSIKSIELITNPSAKYNPEGLSGIINIVLHKNTKIGFNGNVNVGLAYQDNPKFNSGIDLNYRNGKFNFYTNYSNNISTNANYGHIDRENDNTLQLFNFLDKSQSHLIKLGIDYYINDKNTLSIFTTQNGYNGGLNGDTSVLFANDVNNIFQTNTIDNSNYSQQYNFNYKLDFDNDGAHNIEFEVNYNPFESDSFANNQFNIQPNFIEDNAATRDRTTINLDYTKPISKTGKLELGLQARLFSNEIIYESDARLRDQLGIPFANRTNFDYSRNIYSAYFNYSKKISKWSYQLGLRAETVEVSADAVELNLDNNSSTKIPFANDYIQLYPSAFLTYMPSEKNSYQFSYSRRVDRPGVGQVNPLPEWNTPLISSFGNQALQPQFTNSVELNYTKGLKKGSVTAGVFFRLIEDEINRSVSIDRADLNRAILTFDNFDNTTAYGFELSSNYKPTNWWNINGSFDVFAQTQKSISETLNVPTNQATLNDIKSETITVDNVVWNFRLSNNFKVNKALSFSLFGLYRGANEGVQFKQKPFVFVNAGMRYNFLEEKRATFSLNFNDIFNTMQYAFEGDRPYRQVGAFNWESQTVFAGLSYRFGGGKYRAKSRKRRDNDEKSGGGSLF